MAHVTISSIDFAWDLSMVVLNPPKISDEKQISMVSLLSSESSDDDKKLEPIFGGEFGGVGGIF